MRIQLTFLLALFTLGASASSDKEMTELFTKYDQVMLQHKVELVDEVFTEKFLKDSGGKAEFVQKVKELPLLKSRMLKSPEVSWKKGNKDEIFFANLKPDAMEKKKASHDDDGSRFIVVREGGKLKIDGTMSDAN